MKKVFKNFFLVMVAMAASLGFVACSDDDDNEVKETINLEGKWLCSMEQYKELLIIQADHSFLSTGTDDKDVWLNVKGSIKLDGDNFSIIAEDGDNSNGTFTLADNKLSLISADDEVYTYNKLLENFSLTGAWKCSKTESYVKALKDEIHLPAGSIVNGEEILTTIKTAEVKGEFVEKAIEAYFRDVEFKDNGEMTYKVIKEGVETPMTKNYELANNMLKITGKVGTVDISNQFMVFQKPNHTETFLFLTKENIADMFVGYALMLREGKVSEGTIEALKVFRKEFMEVFENFATIIYLQKQ